MKHVSYRLNHKGGINASNDIYFLAEFYCHDSKSRTQYNDTLQTQSNVQGQNLVTVVVNEASCDQAEKWHLLIIGDSYKITELQLGTMRNVSPNLLLCFRKIKKN